MQNKFLHLLSSPAHLMQFYPLIPASEGFKRNFPDFWVSYCRTQGLGKNPASDGKLWSTDLPPSPEILTEGNTGQVTVLAPSYAKMEGKWSSWKELLILIYLILYWAIDKAKAGSRSQSLCAWIKAGNHCLQDSATQQRSHIPVQATHTCDKGRICPAQKNFLILEF